MKNVKEKFEANMLDGDKIDDCGGAMISAKACLEYAQETLSDQKKEIREYADKTAYEVYTPLRKRVIDFDDLIKFLEL